jgi:hypothetical protein
MDSNGHVPDFIEVDIGYALRCTTSIDRSCKLPRHSKISADNQVFYGRYLRKLSNLTQEAVGEMSKVRPPATDPWDRADSQTAEEKLNAFKTVTAYNSQPMEGNIFSKRVDGVFQLAKKEAYMTGIFWGASGLTGNLAMLCLLGYGMSPLHFLSDY